jgi:hypothetical protein
MHDDFAAQRRMMVDGPGPHRRRHRSAPALGDARIAARAFFPDEKAPLAYLDLDAR